MVLVYEYAFVCTDVSLPSMYICMHAQPPMHGSSLVATVLRLMRAASTIVAIYLPLIASRSRASEELGLEMTKECLIKPGP